MHLNISKLLILLLIMLEILKVEGFVDPVTFVVGGSVVGIITYFIRETEYKTKTYEYVSRAARKVCEIIGACEGCEDYWIPGNLEALEYELKSEVFGQDLAVVTVLDVLRSHLRGIQPSRSLVLSFHGSPGTGKNFMSEKILKNMFKKGDKTEYVKFFRGSSDFPLKEKVGKYMESLVKEINEKVYRCHRSIFVFDEVEKMPNGILDVISGFVNARRVGDHDFRRIIFILLSNVGSHALNQATLNAFNKGIPREELSLKELSNILAKEAYNGEGGLQYTNLVKNHDISYYVPFLPLERVHIVECLKSVVSKLNQKMSLELTEQVLKELTFFPEPNGLFSNSGCKGVQEKASMLIEREVRNRRKRGI